VQSLDACFVWSVIAALHPIQSNTNRKLSYPHYTTVLNLKDIKFPMTLNQIKKFENLNIFINTYSFEKQKEMTILPLRLIDMKKDKHVNLLYAKSTEQLRGAFYVDQESVPPCEFPQ